MPEVAVKKRLRKAKLKAKALLSDSNHLVIALDFSLFDLLAMRKKEIRLIRVLLDEPTAAQRKALQEFRCTDNCTKEVWVKDFNSIDFNILEIL